MPALQDGSPDTNRDSDSHRYVITVKTLKLAEKIRLGIMKNIKPRPWVFVITNKNKQDKFEIGVADEFSRRLNDKRFDQVKKYVYKLVKNNKDVITEAQLVEMELEGSVKVN